MQVIKVLNNSLLLAVDDNGYEVVLMGKGIGFNKSIGYKIKEEDIEKVFVLKDKEVSKNIIQLANEIDAKYFILAKTIIDYAKEKYHLELMEYIYLSLTDHIAFTMRRIKAGAVIPNLYNAVIRQFNNQEYDIGRFAVIRMEEDLNIHVPEEEIGNIAIHFINAQENIAYNSDDSKIMSFVNSILDIVKYNFMIRYNVDNVSFNRFVIHLQSFSYQLISNTRSVDDVNTNLYTEIFNLYPEEKNCADKIGTFILQNYHIKISDQEILYLTIHIHKILVESRGDK